MSRQISCHDFFVSTGLGKSCLFWQQTATGIFQMLWGFWSTKHLTETSLLASFSVKMLSQHLITSSSAFKKHYEQAKASSAVSPGSGTLQMTGKFVQDVSVFRILCCPVARKAELLSDHVATWDAFGKKKLDLFSFFSSDEPKSRQFRGENIFVSHLPAHCLKLIKSISWAYPTDPLMTSHTPRGTKTKGSPSDQERKREKPEICAKRHIDATVRA